jgi:hypothetical protein
LWFWDLNSGPTLWATPPALFLCVCDGFFKIQSYELFAQAGFKPHPPGKLRLQAWATGTWLILAILMLYTMKASSPLSDPSIRAMNYVKFFSTPPLVFCYSNIKGCRSQGLKRLTQSLPPIYSSNIVSSLTMPSCVIFTLWPTRAVWSFYI